MKTVRLGIVGMGNMGKAHANNLVAGKIKGMELAAFASPDAAKLAAWPNVCGFTSVAKMIRSGSIDALLIATPHYSHTDIGIAALKAGLHVLVEKPLSVHKADALRLLAAHKNKRQVFGVVFNQRTDPFYQKIRSLIQDGELGRVRRVQWTITDWFRTNAYYSSSDWRATWEGEGGGVLLNQCLHNLDLYQWLFGMPQRVTGFCQFGRYHPIEVEDDVTAHFEYDDGMHATLITSTGEAPGTNRLEIAAENGRVVYENDLLKFTRNAVSASEFSRKSKEGFARPAVRELEFKFDSHGGQHAEILQNFADAIRFHRPLIGPAAEGIRSVELVNAVLLSAWVEAPVELPIKAKVYERELAKRIAESRRRRRK